MKEVVIASGKGGAGKTSLTAALTKLFEKEAVFCDCDVDASNLNLLFNTETIQEEKFYSGEKACIDKDKCIKCGACERTCRFDAIQNFEVEDISCEGCKACFDVCPVNAISFSPNYCGDWMISQNKEQLKLVHAKLFPAEDNSGKLVTKIKAEAKNLAQNLNRKIILNDAPPGIGCPVMATLTQSSLLILLVECSLSGIHDAKRLITVAKQLKVPILAVLNKSSLDEKLDSKALELLKEEQIELIAKIPFSQELISLLENEQSWLRSKDQNVTDNIQKIYLRIAKELTL